VLWSATSCLSFVPVGEQVEQPLALGHLHLPKLRVALEAHFKNVSARKPERRPESSMRITGPPPKFQQNSGQPVAPGGDPAALNPAPAPR
jgi:hypothetical protein